MIRRALISFVLLAAVSGPLAGEWAEGPPARAAFYASAAALVILAGWAPGAVRERASRLRLPTQSGFLVTLALGWILVRLLRRGSVDGPIDGPLVLALLPAGLRGLQAGAPDRDRATARDALVVAILHLVLSGSGAALVGATATVLGIAALLPVLAAAEAAAGIRGPPLDSDAEPEPAPPPRGGPGIAAWTVPATALAAALLFVAIPRFQPGGGKEPLERDSARQRPSAGRGTPRGESVTGLPENRVSLDDIGRLHQDFRPILEMTVFRDGRPSDAEEFGARFRSQALETFDGSAWRNDDPAARRLRDGDDGTVDGFIAVPQRGLPPRAASERVEQRLRMLAPGSGALFCLGMPVRVGGRGSVGGVLLLPRGEVRTPDFYGEGETFTIGSVVARGDYPALAKDVPEGARRDALLALPPGHGQAAALARASLGGANPGRATLLALESLLARRCAYSLDVAPAGTLSPVESFLFESRRGHCELFASSAAVMLRAVGVPARIVLGFRGGAFDPVLAKYTLRGADAHAWVEAWFEGEGWVTFDPTPSAEGPPKDLPPPEDGERAAGDGDSWIRRVLGFDGKARGRLLGKIGDASWSLLSTAFTDGEGGSRWSSILLLSAALLALCAARHLPRRGPPAPEGATPSPPPVPPEAWGILLVRLADGGVHRAGSETAREFVRRALADGAAPADAVARVLGAYEGERWGGRTPGGPDRAALCALATSVRVPPR